MPTDGNAVVVADQTETLTPNQEEQPGTSDDQQDLTEVVAGLSRTITGLKKQLAAKAVAPDDDTKTKLIEAETRATKAEAKAAKAELLVKYGDVATIIQKLMSKDNFDPSLIDDDFVNEIRAAKGTPAPTGDEEVSVAHNPQRGRPNTQEQQDEANLKAIKSIFDL